MKFIQTERHTVIVTKTIEIPNEVLIEKFGSVKKGWDAYDNMTDEWQEEIEEYLSEFVTNDSEFWWSESEGCVDIDRKDVDRNTSEG